MESLARFLGGCIFFSSRGYFKLFLQFPFLMFWNSINLAYVTQHGEEDFVHDYRFTSRRESDSVSDMVFLI